MDDQDQTQEGALDTAGEAMGYDSPEELSPDTSGLAAPELGVVPYARREYEAAKGKSEASFQEVLNQINAAKQRLLAQPTELTRQQYLQGLASKLTTPPERTDPRFYERRNLYTFLRDVGQYGAQQEAAQKAAQLKQAEEAGKLDQLIAKYGLETAQKREAEAAALLGKARESAATKIPAGIQEVQYHQSVLDDPKATPAQKRFSKAWLDKQTYIAPQKDPADVIKGQMLQDAIAITSNPDAYTPEQVKAAQITVDRMTPPDVRKAQAAKESTALSFKSRLQQTRDFVNPDIDRAVKLIEENPKLAAGITGSLVKGVPFVGQASKDVYNLLESIRANVGFEKMEELKRLSPTGASGLGAVSNAEQRLLQAVKGSLEQDSSAENLVFNLKRLKTFYNETLPSMMSAAGYDLGGASAPPTLQEQAAAERARREKAKKGG